MADDTNTPEPVLEIKVTRAGDAFMTHVRVNGQPVGLLQSLTFEVEADRPSPSAQARLVVLGDRKEYEQLLRSIPWLDLEVEHMDVLPEPE